MIFNFFAFWELVAVNLGMSAYKWLTEQRKLAGWSTGQRNC